MQIFKAYAQYGDWEGTAAADDSDTTSLERYLKKKGLIESGEFLVAASLWAGENHDGKLGIVSVSAYLFKGPEDVESVKKALEAIDGPIPVREVDLPLKLEEFVCMFKRFGVMLTWHGVQLGGREYHVIEE